MPPKIRRTRGGKKFIFTVGARTKRVAQNKARGFRARNFLARVVKVKSGYEIFTAPK